MADTKYAYTISTDFSNGVVSYKLAREINLSSITIGVRAINTEGDTCDVWMKDALSTAEKTTLDGLVGAHDGVPDPVDAVQKVKVVEEIIETDGSYSAFNFYFSTSLVEDVSDTKTFPYPINIMSGEYEIATDNQDDEVSLIIGEDTIIGDITANVLAGDTTIKVDDSVLAKTAKGYFLKLDDGVNTNNLGRVISVDKVAKTVKVETAAVNAFNASTPTNIKQTAKILDKVKLGHPGRVTFGEDKVGGSYVPANMEIKAVYSSKAAVAKKFYPIIKHLY